MSSADVAVFCAGQSLVEQVTAWCDDHREVTLLLSDGKAEAVGAALEMAIAGLIDATDHPARAMSLLQQSVVYVGPERLAVYTEELHDGLELFVRLRGVMLLMGPMPQAQWEDFFGHRLALRLPARSAMELQMTEDAACRHGGAEYSTKAG